jgi:hypothetical protein
MLSCLQVGVSKLQKMIKNVKKAFASYQLQPLHFVPQFSRFADLKALALYLSQHFSFFAASLS